MLLWNFVILHSMSSAHIMFSQLLVCILPIVKVTEADMLLLFNSVDCFTPGLRFLLELSFEPEVPPYTFTHTCIGSICITHTNFDTKPINVIARFLVRKSCGTSLRTLRQFLLKARLIVLKRILVSKPK